MNELEGRFFGNEDAMFADIASFHFPYGEYNRKRRQFTSSTGDRVRWIMYTSAADMNNIAGVEFSKILLDVSMAGLDMSDYQYILSRLRKSRVPSAHS